MSKPQSETYKFCPRCGSSLVKKSNFILDCSECNLHFFLTFKPGAGAIIEDQDGKILVTTRGIEPKKGTWDFPGGFMQLNENLEEALCRELNEELELKIKPTDLTYIGSFLEVYPYQDIDYDVLVAFYYARITDEQKSKLMPHDDVSAIDFKYRNELDEKTSAWKSNLDALDAYLQTHSL